MTQTNRRQKRGAAASTEAAASTMRLTNDELQRTNAYWRAANYLSVGQIYLRANPLLREPLRLEHVKPRLLGHWGTTPGLNFVYVHLNRLIRQRDLDMIYIAGPGHGGPPGPPTGGPGPGHPRCECRPLRRRLYRWARGRRDSARPVQSARGDRAGPGPAPHTRCAQPNYATAPGAETHDHV